MIVSHPAPDFTAEAAVNGSIEKVSLSSHRGRWVVLFFYPLDFTFVCPTEITAFSDRAAEFEKLNAQVLGCSIDSVYTHLAWIATPRSKGGLGKLNFPLLSDLDRGMTRNYEIAMPDGKALRGLFIIDPQGVVQCAMVNNLSVGRSVDETLRLLQAYQFTAQHGEVCPANWKPGGATLKADPKDSLEYFGKAHGKEREPELV